MKKTNYLTCAFMLLALALPVRLRAQAADEQSVSPDGKYVVKEAGSDNWAIFDREGQPEGPASGPKHRGYDQLLTAWSPDSQKVAIIAMKLKVSDLYVLGAQRAYDAAELPVENMKQLVIERVQSSLRGSPKAYKFFSAGPLGAKWISSTELEVKTKFVFALQLDFRAAAKPDIRDCTFSYILDLADEPAVKSIHLLGVEKSPYTGAGKEARESVKASRVLLPRLFEVRSMGASIDKVNR